MFDALKNRLARVGAWFTSPRGRLIWTRILLILILIPVSPYIAVLWRIMIQGSASDQTAVIYIGLVILTLIRLHRKWKRTDKPAGNGEESDRNAGTGPASARKTKRKGRNRG
ncbi:hypothetical protein [Bifidobacterium felsineum]|uniref:hypothetical protein n=1 Tax=Bifidobacterium felsineum TaxID=2045440 RepID=UPI001BDC2648|nr:hypothetical protein [Bifidobacterium felsineum]MBT1164830.1 hypothetical protein [Bifidobacterium felsineum]